MTANGECIELNSPECEKILGDFCEYIGMEKAKGKIPFIITGSGISPDVPNLERMMAKLESQIENRNWERSDTFTKIYGEYISAKNDRVAQSQFLTYIQDAYLGKKPGRYVDEKDCIVLEEVWNDYLIWLLRGGTGADGEKFRGLLDAGASLAHEEIARLCIFTGAVTITTNFDNLLSKATSFKDRNFYPLLDERAFHEFFTSEEADNSIIEVQTRGDVFWVKCTGKKNKICPNRGTFCYVPTEYAKADDDGITCKLCGSPVKIHFSFPGTKDKDREMSNVMKGIWRFLAYRCSCVIVIGSSMNYDPILLSFVQEMLSSRGIRLIYVSKMDEKGKPAKNDATKLLFGNSMPEDKEKANKRVWICCKDAPDFLKSLNDYFADHPCLEGDKTEKYEYMRDFLYRENCIKLIGNADDGTERSVKEALKNFDFGCKIIDNKHVQDIKNYSQLGLKTYWLMGKQNATQHNRYKHSLGVMMIASIMYLAAKGGESLNNELRFLQIAAMLHDVGHLPFSHLIEEIFDELAWIPAGSNHAFDHGQYTNRRIKKFMKDKGFNEILSETNYSADDLIKLIRGEFGVGYLDTIINGPFDADKIEYLYSDAIFINSNHRAMFEAFLNQVCKGLAVNSNYMLTIDGASTQKMIELLKMRGQMYDSLYLRKGLRYLEACCQLIIRTFFVYKCTEEDMLKEEEDEESGGFYNLSDKKINYVIKSLAELVDKITDKKDYDKPVELEILKEMRDYLLTMPCISSTMRETVNSCLNLIVDTTGADAISELENDKILTKEITGASVDRGKLKKLTKSVYLRFPGVLLIDYVKSQTAFSMGSAGKRKKRGDNTEESVESVLVRNISQSAHTRNEPFKCLSDAASEIVRQLNIPNHEYVNIYQIGNNPFLYMQAEDFFLSELRKLGLNV
ncbi:MAG: HD domain-containing protein [Lachnospiraceae bacterium]|jgi:HD superfamily phosphohydrolase/NAD-dependent SIR2 family protein deacetylase|nr:HD domain-containing protein [Lachnospiraceae bacterium]